MSPTATARCGDIAVTFAAARPGRTRGDAPWQPVARVASWTVWRTEPTAGWAGFPLELADDGARLLLGDRRDHWLSIELDPVSGRCTVVTDRFATVQAYRRVDGPPAVATFSPALWGADPPLDWEAIAGFLALGWYPGDRMPVEGIRILRPATTHSWSGDGDARPTHRRVTWDHQPEERSARDASDELAELLGDILRERAAETRRLLLPISGGLDSRSTLAAITDPGGPCPDGLRALSYGYGEASVETALARELASARGVPIEVVSVPPYLLDELDVVLAATEGLVDLAVCRQACVRELLREDADAVVAAHWGDVWFGMTTPAPDQSLSGQFVARSLKRGRRWLLDHLVSDRVHDPLRWLEDLMAAELEALPEVQDRTVAAAALKTEQWSWRFTEASLRMHQAGTDPILPFYDERMADFALTLPGPLLTGRRLQIDALVNHSPDLASVVWEEYETDLFGLSRRWTTGLPRRVVRGIGRRLRPPRAVRENWEVQFGPDQLDRWRTWLLRSDSPGPGLVEPAALTALIDRVRRGDRDAGHALSRLVTFVAWIERYTR